MAALAELCHSWSGGWRQIARYANELFQSPRHLTRCQYGVLLRAPFSLVSAVCPILTDHGGEYRLFDCGPKPKPARVLLLDSMFVVAEDFSVGSYPRAS